MADKKITELTDYPVVNSSDVFPVVDVATPETKKVTLANLISSIFAGIGDIIFGGDVDHTLKIADQTTTDAPGKSFNIAAGKGNGVGDGGSVNLAAGNADAGGNGGDLNLSAGYGTINGRVMVQDPATGFRAIFNPASLTDDLRDLQLPDANGKLALESAYTFDLVVQVDPTPTYATLHFVAGVLQSVT